jgi:hypothetical protein
MIKESEVRDTVKSEIKRSILMDKFKKYPEVVKYVRGKIDSELVNSDLWDKLAFGFISHSIIQLPVKKLKLKYPSDMVNVVIGSMKSYFKGVPFDSLPPIEASYKNGKFYIEDGHHRCGYAIELGLNKVPVLIRIEDNPFKKLGFDIDDVVALRDFLKQ